MLAREIAVLVPTRKRPEGLRRVLQSLMNTAPECELVVIADPDDWKARAIAQVFGAIYVEAEAPRLGCANAWNTGLAAMPGFSAYVLGADDVVFQSAWLMHTLEALDEVGGSGLVGFNDGRKNGNEKFASHYLMTRDFIIQHHGGVMAVPHYTAEFVDAEANLRARAAGKFIWAERARVLHLWEGPDGDETYRLAASKKAENRALFEERKLCGFPDDFTPILTKG